MKRRGEKFGWIGGWLGGFLWLGLLSAVWLFQNKISNGMIGIAVFVVAIIDGGLESIGLKWTAFFLVIPCLIPFVTTGNRTWNSSAIQGNSPNKAN
jgi:hypothetical protein